PGVYTVGAERFGTLREDLGALIRHAATAAHVVGVPAGLAIPALRALDWLRLSPLAPWHYLTYHTAFFFDISRAVRELEWRPRYGNAEMLVESYDWFLAHRDSADAAGRRRPGRRRRGPRRGARARRRRAGALRRAGGPRSSRAGMLPRPQPALQPGPQARRHPRRDGDRVRVRAPRRGRHRGHRRARERVDRPLHVLRGALPRLREAARGAGRPAGGGAGRAPSGARRLLARLPRRAARAQRHHRHRLLCALRRERAGERDLPPDRPPRRLRHHALPHAGAGAGARSGSRRPRDARSGAGRGHRRVGGPVRRRALRRPPAGTGGARVGGAVDSPGSGAGESRAVLFEEVRAGGCMSYLIGCAETCSAVLVDPELSQIDRYLALAARAGLRLHYLIDP